MAEQRITFTLHHLVNELDRIADGILRRQFSMTYSQFQFMVALQENDQLDVTNLAVALGVSKAAVSKRAPWFVHRGFVALSHESAGVRRLVLSLTPNGDKLITAASEALDATFVEQASRFDGLDLEELHTDLKNMLKRIRTYKQES